MSRFAPIAEIPEGLPAGLSPVLQSMKQNLELLTGQRGNDKLAEAVRYGDVSSAEVAQRSAVAVGDPPTKAEFDLLVEDMEELIARFNYLVAQLKGGEVGT